MAKSTNNRGGRNNNPSGHNQYSNSWVDTAKERPVATAAAAAAAVGAGVFLWSRRNQITDQISNLSDQVTSWAEGMTSASGTDEWDNSAGANTGSSNTRMSSSGSTSGSSGSRTGSTGSSSSRRSGGKSSRGSAGLDEIGVIEVDTVTL